MESQPQNPEFSNNSENFHPFICYSMFNPLKTRNPKMDTLANSEDPDEMPHNAAFHQGLHCLLRRNQSSNTIFLKIIICDPSIYTMDDPGPIKLYGKFHWYKKG